MKKYYFHITDVPNVGQIVKHGLRCNTCSRKIYLFTPGILNDLARRLSFHTLALFRIDRGGITQTIENDALMRNQYFVKQKRIEPEHVLFVGIYSRNKTGRRYHKNRRLTDFYINLLGCRNNGNPII